jgi:phage shock protein PspC (stress-responsive transcriptional regulator)
MNKTISINLSGQNFIIEEDAYHMLRNYLDEIKKHCGPDTDSEEVISDIELSIAEKLNALLTPYKEVIDEKDIDSLIKVMGTAEDFNRDIGEVPEAGEDRAVVRKLYRDTDNAVIAGVASGLAAYFDTDPVLFRILFFALMFASGFGILAYIVFWIAMPEAKTASQKLEMRGERTTISALERMSKRDSTQKGNWKDRWESFSVFGKIFSLPFIAINEVFKAFKKVVLKLWPIVKFVFGLFLLGSSFLVLAFAAVGSFYLLLQFHSAYSLSFVPVGELIKVIPFPWMVLSGFFSLAIPAGLVLCCGLAIMRKKNIITFNAGAILIALWMIAGVSFCSLCLRYLPDLKDKIDNYPAMQTVTKSIDASEINELTASGRNIYVDVIPGNDTTAVLSGRKADIDAINVNKEEGSLKLSQINTEDRMCFICDHRSVKLTISGATLKEIRAENRASITIEAGLKNSPALIADDYAEISWQGANVSSLVATSSRGSSVNISGLVLDSQLIAENRGQIAFDNSGGGTARATLSGGDSSVRLSGKIDNLSIESKAGDRENIFASELRAGTVSIDGSAGTMVVAGEAQEIKSIKAAAVKLLYTGKTKLTGKMEEYKILKYEKVSESEFERRREEDNPDGGSNQSKEFVSGYDDYFILNRGNLEQSAFESFVDDFRNETANY